MFLVAGASSGEPNLNNLPGSVYIPGFTAVQTIPRVSSRGAHATRSRSSERETANRGRDRSRPAHRRHTLSISITPRTAALRVRSKCSTTATLRPCPYHRRTPPYVIYSHGFFDAPPAFPNRRASRDICARHLHS